MARRETSGSNGPDLHNFTLRGLPFGNKLPPAWQGSKVGAVNTFLSTVLGSAPELPYKLAKFHVDAWVRHDRFRYMG